jgi:hypothetical protein
MSKVSQNSLYHPNSTITIYLKVSRVFGSHKIHSHETILYGPLNCGPNYIPNDTQHALLRTQRASRELTSFQLVFTDTGNTTWEFEAYVNGFSVSGAVDGVVEAQVTLEISGAITETP